MLSDDGFVKILDFGLAKFQPASRAATAQNSTQTVTKAGVILGSPAYMSPQQACGREVDSRSDQFSLGAILYEMASGRNPFSAASTVQTLSAIIERDPEPLSSGNSTASPELAAVVRRCLQKEPENRFPTTGELASALSDLQLQSMMPATKPRQRTRLCAGSLVA